MSFTRPARSPLHRRRLQAVAALAGAGLAVGVAAALPAGAASTTPWQRIAPPAALAGKSAVLYGVSALDSTHAWAVGQQQTGNAAATPLIVTITGTVPNLRTALVPLPGITWTGQLRRILALSATDVWAAGTDDAGLAHLLHWDGKTWSETSFPGQGSPDIVFYTIAGSAGHQPWILVQDESGPGLSFLHRAADGSWTKVAVPPDPEFTTRTMFVARDGTLWVAGLEYTPSSGQNALEVYHYVAGKPQLATPAAGAPDLQAYNVAVGPDGIWVGGQNEDGTSAIANYAGHAWHSGTFAQAQIGPSPVLLDTYGKPAWSVDSSTVDTSGTFVQTYLKYSGTTSDGGSRWVRVRSAPDIAPETGPVSIHGINTIPGTAATVAVGEVASSSGGTLPRIEVEDVP